MRKVFSFLLSVFFITGRAFSQYDENYKDSLLEKFNYGLTDSIRCDAGFGLSDYYFETNRDSSLKYADECILLTKKNNKKIDEAWARTDRAYQLIHKGQYPEALPELLEAFRIVKNPASEKYLWQWQWWDRPKSPHERRLLTLSYVNHMYAILMGATGNDNLQLFHFNEARQIAKEINDTNRILLADMNLCPVYQKMDKMDSAIMFGKEAEQLVEKSGNDFYLGSIYFDLGVCYASKKDTAIAKQYFYRSIQSALNQNNLSSLWPNYGRLAGLYLATGNKDSSLYYAIKMTEAAKSLGGGVLMGECYNILYRSYKLRNQIDSAFKYQGLALVTKDSLYSEKIRNLSTFQKLSFNEQIRLKQLEEERVKQKSKIRTYALLAGLGVFIVVALLLYRNNRQKHKAKNKIEEAYVNLKATQQQLIQSEKMASLGELTAGIAHEIQNPLNFVNNFSEVNKELLIEMKEEIDKGNIKEAKLIADNAIANQEKIELHGKRADAIVKGMLQHSRSSNGQKEPTDINVLADEYLRLAYHGLRAKDKSFNATMKTDFDKSIGSVNIIPQDIGRVILNLITNAFYAVNEKKKLQAGNYEPIVTVSTRVLKPLQTGGGLGVEISVKDNGNGIPQKALDKIFQPFFTTKPTGQGTGLGLSLSYDIVKAHGGVLKVETKEGEGSTFSIQLPDQAS